MEFARDLLAQAKSPRRRDILAGSKTFFDKVRTDEDKKLSTALEKLGVTGTQDRRRRARARCRSA
jgi:hypothetical protein